MKFSWRSIDWKTTALFGAAGAAGGAGLWYLLKRGSTTGALPPPPQSGLQKGVTAPPNPCDIARYAPPTSEPLNLVKSTGVCPEKMDLLGFPEDLSQRENYILDKVRSFQFDAVFAPLVSRANGHEMQFWAMGDAMKINGIRVNASAKLEQQIADSLDMSLLTPKLADLIFKQADIRLDPITRPPTKYVNGVPVWVPPMESTQAMILQSWDVDKAIQNRGGVQGRDQYVVSTVGKHWVLDNDMLASAYPGFDSKGNPITIDHRGKAENYGWHYMSKTEKEKNDEPSVTDPANMQVKQGRGWRHDINHADYSQNVVLIDNRVTVDGKPMLLQEVMTSKELAPLVTHNGQPLKVLRQPGVPQLSVAVAPKV